MRDDGDIFQANPPGLTRVLTNAAAFVAGAGGLGSNVAMLLVRAGIGKLTIADFDRVSASNLNRQWYTRHQLGKLKVEALRDNLLDINPDVQVEIFPVRLSEENFSTVIPLRPDLIFECFDSPAAKAELTRFVLTYRRDIPYIAVSGIGGAGALERLCIREVRHGFFLIGDGETDVADGIGTLSTRVMAAAAAQAHCGITLLNQLALKRPELFYAGQSLEVAAADGRQFIVGQMFEPDSFQNQCRITEGKISAEQEFMASGHIDAMPEHTPAEDS